MYKLLFKMNDRLFVILVACKIQIICMSLAGKHAPDIMLSQPYLIQFSNGGIKLTVPDFNHTYDEVQLNGSLKCFDFNQYVNSTYELINNLQYSEPNKEWLFQNLSIPYCLNGNLTYKLIANPKSRVQRHALPNEEKAATVAKQTNLLSGATHALVGALKLDNILGDQNSNEHKHNIQTNAGPTLPVIQECEKSKTTINYEKSVCKQELIFADEFNEMDWNIWDRDIRIPLDTEDADFVSFQNLKQNLYVKNGSLYILPKLLTEVSGYDDESIRAGTLNLGLNCTGTIDRSLECKREAFAFRILPPVVSARISTKKKFTFKYGIVEIRAKLPKGDWLFPQLFLEPSLNSYGISGYSSGQIRLAFIRSNEILDSKDGKEIDGFRLLGGVVLAQDEKYREMWMKDTLRKRNHFGDDYHVYKSIWTDEFISFYVDDVEYGRIYGNFGYEAFDLNDIQHAEYWKTGNKMAPFDKEFFLSLGVSCGGISDFPDSSLSGRRESDLKPWINSDAKNELNFWRAKNRWFSTWNGEDAALKVDYVRVWAL